MPVTIQKNKVKFKDPNNQGYISFDAIAGETSAQLVASLNARAEEIKNGNWPATSQELTTKVNDLVKIQNNEPATTSTTQVWVNPTATSTAVPTYEEFTGLSDSVDGLESALNQQTTDVEILHDKGSNVIQPQASEYINYVMSNGYPGQANSARAIGPYIYLPINANAIWGVASGYTFTAACQYDRYHNYIGQYSTLHVNARYMRFCIRKDDSTNISPAEAAAAFSFTLTYDSNYITKSQGKNLLDQTKAVNGYISNNAGAITTAGAAYHTSDYIPITSGQKITISPSVRIFLAFNTSKSPITTSYMNTETNNYTYTATADGYVRFSYRDQNANVTQAEYGATVTSYVPYQTEIESDIHLNEVMRSDVQDIVGGDSIVGKKFLLFGDSIMHGAGNSNYGVGDILQEKYAMSFWDYCESGALVEYKEGRTQTPIYQQIANAIAAGRNPDFIIMDGLSNDINAGTLGEISADFDYVAHGYNTFGAALEYCFGQLRTSYPEIPVLYVIPHSSNARDYTLELQFGNLAREICKKWSVPIADVYRDGNMTARIPAQLQAFTYYPTETSGTHPNRAGYDFAYMPLIISWLKNVYANID